jgi:hypothetical protein
MDSWYRAVLGVCYVGRRGAVRCLDRIMHPSGAHSRRTRDSLGSTQAKASRRNAFGRSETARNGSKTHEKRLYSPLTPATDVGQPLMPWDGVGGGLRWPSVVVSEQASERAPRALFLFLGADFCLYQNISIFLFSYFPAVNMSKDPERLEAVVLRVVPTSTRHSNRDMNLVWNSLHYPDVLLHRTIKAFLERWRPLLILTAHGECSSARVSSLASQATRGAKSLCMQLTRQCINLTGLLHQPLIALRGFRCLEDSVDAGVCVTGHCASVYCALCTLEAGVVIILGNVAQNRPVTIKVLMN